jgi:hypothetical protein
VVDLIAAERERLAALVEEKHKGAFELPQKRIIGTCDWARHQTAADVRNCDQFPVGRLQKHQIRTALVSHQLPQLRLREVAAAWRIDHRQHTHQA